MRFSAECRGTAGHTKGLSINETIVSTGSSQLAVNGSRFMVAGGFKASRSMWT